MSSASLSLTIDHQSRVPIYQQLQQQIENLVSQHRLKSGDKLPSSRELAIALGISRTSSLKAIDNLIAEGVLISRVKQGVFVSNTPPNFDKPMPVSKQTKTKAREFVTGFNSGADTAKFPHRLWAQSMRNAWLNPDDAVLQGRFADGLPALKQQIVDYVKQLRGLQCCAEQIIVTAGNRDALTILSHALLQQKSDRVWLENPCYPQVPSLFRWLGKDIKPLALDEEGAIPPKRATGLALLTPCRQYPLGLAMSSERRQLWLNLLKQSTDAEQKLWLIEDDYDNEFVYQGRSPVPLMQQDSTQSTFFVGSFSKVMFRGLRLGFIVSPLSQVTQLIDSQQQLGFAGALAVQPALADFMQSGKFATHIRKMRRNYLQKRDVMAEQLAKLSQFLDWQLPHGGMHLVAYLKLPYEKLEHLICTKLHEQGVSINSLSSHYITSDKRYGFILGFSQPNETELTRAINILHQVLRQC
ncbi:MocR-like pyridoxine biosynthesis transcription factor PdxR [Thalassotalea marina]|uniref:Transcriptional regulator n=1 Tax=Thalassotalea marina TaxID=1673741 RepID=A0A919BJN7_9GAMM|nr:PLP-dependent aminotransferase family protein [Thalassotalea marina]GHF94683.1 transcriptional regulator [Thalassotalea marina]